MKENHMEDERKDDNVVKEQEKVDALVDKAKYQESLETIKKKRRDRICTLFGICVLAAFLIFWFTHPHKYGDWVVVKEPACVEEGLKKRSCFCGHDETEKLPNLGGHVEVIDEATEATCIQKGVTEGKHCSVCKEVLVAQEVVEALGHEVEKLPAVEPTCIKEGLTEGSYCTRCEEVLLAQNPVLQVDHTFKKNICEVCKIYNFDVEIEEIELIYVDKVPALRCAFAPQAYIHTEEYTCTLKFTIKSTKVNASHQSKMTVDVNKKQEFVLKISGASPINENVKVTVEIYDEHGNVLDKDNVTRNWKK